MDNPLVGDRGVTVVPLLPRLVEKVLWLETDWLETDWLEDVGIDDNDG